MSGLNGPRRAPVASALWPAQQQRRAAPQALIRPAAEEVQQSNPFAKFGLKSTKAAPSAVLQKTQLKEALRLRSFKARPVGKENIVVSQSPGQIVLAGNSSSNTSLVQRPAMCTKQQADPGNTLHRPCSSSAAAIQQVEGLDANRDGSSQLVLNATPKLSPADSHTGSGSGVEFTCSPRLSPANSARITAVAHHSPLPSSPTHVTNFLAEAGFGSPLEAFTHREGVAQPPTVPFWKPAPFCMPPIQSQFSVPTNPAGPTPFTPSSTPEGSGASPVLPTKPIKPATRTTPIFGGARKLFVRSKTDKGRAKPAPRAPGQGGVQVPRAPLRTGAPTAAGATPHQALSPSARVRGLLMGGRQLAQDFEQPASGTCYSVPTYTGPFWK